MKTLLVFTLSLLLETATATPPVTSLPDNQNSIQGSCKDLRASASRWWMVMALPIPGHAATPK